MEKKNTAQFNVAVFGARGYTGIETCRLLLNHPHVSSIQLVSNDPSWKLEHDLLEARRSSKALSYISREDFSRRDHYTDEFVFLACSAKDAAAMASSLIEKGARVIDLSGAHRLDREQASRYYGIEHSSEFFCSEKNYGLVPHQKVTAPLVSNPGCYVSSILMALLPLLKQDLIDEDSIVIDSKSGTSGAGRAPKDLTNLSELVDGLSPYKIGQHQHLPEIIRYAEVFANKKINPRFTTTLIPIKRGILSTLYLDLKADFSMAEIIQSYATAYQDYPFVTVYSLGTNEKEDHKLALRNVLHTNQTQITLHLEDRRLSVFSMIDNLMKGAAGQAIENFNHLINQPLTTGFPV